MAGGRLGDRLVDDSGGCVEESRSTPGAVDRFGSRGAPAAAVRCRRLLRVSNHRHTCVSARAKKGASTLSKGLSFEFRAHDLRRTAASFMGEAAVDRFHIAHVLNHRSVTHNSVTAIYDRYRYDRENGRHWRLGQSSWSASWKRSAASGKTVNPWPEVAPSTLVRCPLSPQALAYKIRRRTSAAIQEQLLVPHLVAVTSEAAVARGVVTTFAPRYTFESSFH